MYDLPDKKLIQFSECKCPEEMDGQHIQGTANTRHHPLESAQF